MIRGSEKINIQEVMGVQATACKSDGERYPNDVVFFEEDHDDFVYGKTAESEGEFIIRQKAC